MTVRIGVIGTGAIGRDHARRINQVLAGGEIVALSDVNRVSAEKVKAEIAPEAEIFETGEALIASPKVDAVLVTSWGATHEQYVLAAIAARKPCFCEKPLATSADGAKRIVDAEVAHGKRLVQVGFMRRYDVGYVALKQLVSSRIGAPILVHAAHRNPTVPEQYVTPMAIHDTLIHEIDVFRWLLDDDYVSARVLFPRKAARSHAKLRDPQVVLLETKKGVLIDVEIFVNCHYGYDIQCEVVGEDGIAKLPEPMAVKMRLDATAAKPHSDRLEGSLHQFLRRRASRLSQGRGAGRGVGTHVLGRLCRSDHVGCLRHGSGARRRGGRDRVARPPVALQLNG